MEHSITNKSKTEASKPNAIVIGAGPSGLMAAEVMSTAGVQVTVFDRMPTMGRKFLMAGRGGLNLTHSEPFEIFMRRYGAAAPMLRPAIEAFPPKAVIAWAENLGQQTFTGSSGRIFPKALKASPLLRAWLAQLRANGVKFELRHEWQGWDESDALIFEVARSRKIVHADVTVLALGGASWPKLGANGVWAQILRDRGVHVNEFRPANCGFTISWSDLFRTRFAGAPLKNAGFQVGNSVARGEAAITGYGIEGGAIYELSAQLRDVIAAKGSAELQIDLRPDVSVGDLKEKLAKPHGKQSLTNTLRKSVRLSPMEINLLREIGVGDKPTPGSLARIIKAIPLRLAFPQGLARAISSAGGVAFSSIDESLMLRAVPDCFVAGEMLDWEAPTGGYLLQGCFSTGFATGHAALRRLGLVSPS
jgi:uncharacterized flavoprotein (TIGR03862 family)